MTEKILFEKNSLTILGFKDISKISPKFIEAAYEKLDKTYILKTNKESFGYSCFTNEKQFYVENYPGMVVEKGGIDDLILMYSGGKM